MGTTYPCVVVFQNGKTTIIENERSKRTTPSCVAFTDVECIVGDAAQRQAALNPEITVFDAKRLIGRRFDGACVQGDMKL